MNIFNTEYNILDKIADLMNIEVKIQLNSSSCSGSDLRWNFLWRFALAGIFKRSIPEGDLYRLLLKPRHIQRVQEHLQKLRFAPEEISDQQEWVARSWHIARHERKRQVQVD